MRIADREHTALPWRIHGMTRGFRLEDVWQLPTPGGREDFPLVIEMLTAFDPAQSSSCAVRTLFAIRWKVGALLGWDDNVAHPGALPFTVLYQLDDEWAGEIRNRTVHGIVHIGWVAEDSGVYRAQMAVYVKRNGLLGTAYMAAITPFRHLVVYPRTMHDIEQAWRATRLRRSSSRRRRSGSRETTSAPRR